MTRQSSSISGIKLLQLGGRRNDRLTPRSRAPNAAGIHVGLGEPCVECRRHARHRRVQASCRRQHGSCTTHERFAEAERVANHERGWSQLLRLLDNLVEQQQ